MDNRGSTLIENVIAIFLLALFAVMASVCILSGVNAVKNASLENQRLYEVYTQIESGTYGSLIESDLNSQLTFKLNDQDYCVEGTVYYDKEKKILGEFVRKSTAP